MHSPIARILARTSRWAERKHRRILGPKYAPGDVVETPYGECRLEERVPDPTAEYWYCIRSPVRHLAERNIIRVVRYAGGE